MESEKKPLLLPQSGSILFPAKSTHHFTGSTEKNRCSIQTMGDWAEKSGEWETFLFL